MSGPSYHARTHLPGGTDPLELTSNVVYTPFYAYVATIAETCTLLGYWRLGDGASPFADSSGHAGGPVDMVKTVTGTAMTDSVVGALSAAQDDGAVGFNAVAGAAGDYLSATNARMTGNGDRTAILWVKPTATSSGNKPLYGTYAGAGNGGWVILINGATNTIIFLRADGGGSASATGPDIATNAWTLIGVDWNPGVGVKIYANGALVHTDTNVQGVAGFTTVYLGHAVGSGSVQADVDEAAYFGCRLTADQHAGLYAAGIVTGNADEFKVWTSDGAGGASWQYPTIETFENGA